MADDARAAGALPAADAPLLAHADPVSSSDARSIDPAPAAVPLPESPAEARGTDTDAIEMRLLDHDHNSMPAAVAAMLPGSSSPPLAGTTAAHTPSSSAASAASAVPPTHAPTKVAATTKPNEEVVDLSGAADAPIGPPPAARVPFSKLFRFATPTDWLCMVIGTLGAAASGTVQPLFAILMGNTITVFTEYDAFLARNAVTPYPQVRRDQELGNFQDAVMDLVYKFLWIFLGTFVVSYAQMALWQLSAENQTARIKREYFKALLRQEVAYFDTQKRGELTARITADVEQIQDGIGDKVAHTAQYVTTFFVAFGVAFAKNASITGMLMICVPFIIGSAAFMGKTTMQFMREALVSYGKAGAIAEEVLSALRTIVSFGGEAREGDRYAKHLAGVRVQEAKKGYIVGIGVGLIFFFLFASYSLGFYWGALRIAAGTAEIGELVTVFLNFLVGSFSLGNVAPFISSFFTAMVAASNVFNIIDRPSLVNPFSDEGAKPESVKGHLEFKNIDFAYPTRPDVPILKQFNLTVEAGTTVALVGQSGSGKSTCVGLLERFYLPKSGSISLDGTPIDTLNVGWLRAQIGFVGQEPIMLAGTIRENVSWGSPVPVTDDQIWNALEQANASAFVSDLPDKLDTWLGERGANLSGGQKQRLAIARALIRDPKIIFFDEATSALDAKSEQVVQEALNKAAKGRTAILIAHRLSSVRNANKIVAMRRGEVIESGTHEELMLKNGFYHSLVQDQQVKAEESDNDEEEEAAEPVEGSNGKLLRRPSQAASLNSIAPSTTHSGAKAKATTIEDEVAAEKSPFWRTMRLNASMWKWTLTGVIAAVIAGSVTPTYALVYARAITEYGVHAKNKAKMEELGAFWGLMFLIIAIIAGISNYVQSAAFIISGEAVVEKLRDMCFRALISQEGGFFDRPENGVGALAGKLASEASLVRKLVGDVFGTILQVTMSLVVGAGIAIYSGWELALVTLAGAPVLIAAGIYQGRALKGLNNATADRHAAALASEAVGNVRTIASLGLEATMVKEYVRRISSHHKKMHVSIATSGAAYGFSTGAIFLLYAICFWYAGELIKSEKYHFTDLFQVITTIMFSAMMGGRIAQFLPDYTKASAAAVQLYRVIDRKPSIDVRNQPASAKVLNPAEVRGEIEFCDVRFKYPSRPKVPVHRGLSFKVPAGAKVALCGSSGCGKSTCIQQLQRFYDPAAGSIKLDGIEIQNINLTSLRSVISLVGQEPQLLDGTIMENIKYGAVDPATASDEDVYAAAREADVHNFISSLPLGYQTQVGEKGGMLSGGQKQRVAIARALMRKPKVLLLDEATSALDAESESVVQRALDAASQGRTTISIAHRLSTVVNSDIIFVLHKGKVVERGTFKELMAIKNGHFARLVEAQLEAH